MKLGIIDYPTGKIGEGKAGVEETFEKLSRAKVDIYTPFFFERNKPYWELIEPVMKQARKRGIAVHASVECFCRWEHVGDAPERNYQLGTPELIPERLKQLPEKESWRCPSWPENQDEVLRLIKRLANDYDFDGINLDFIRFCNSEILRRSPCVCAACRKARLQYLGKEVLTHDEILMPAFRAEMNGNEYLTFKSEKMYKEIQYRNKVITGVVRKARKLLKKDQALTVDGRANYFRDAIFEGQDWAEWAKEGLVDMVRAMSYSTSFEYFSKAYVDEHVKIMGNNRARLCEIIGKGSSAGKLSTAEMIRQIEYALAAGVETIYIFAMGSLEESDIDALSEIKR